MKKSKHIQLVLITAALASCSKPKPKDEWTSGNKVHIRSDTSAPYTNARSHHHSGSALWYYAFRPYGHYYGGAYNRVGYYSDAIHEKSNLGNSSYKSNIVRGGFGHSSFSVGS